MRFLLIGSDPGTTRYIQNGMRESGYSAIACRDSAASWPLIQKERWDLIIVDRMLADKTDGLALIKKIRVTGVSPPTVLIDGIGRLLDKIEYLEQGADDVITRPIIFSELLTRIEVLLKHTHPKFNARHLLVEDLWLDTRRFEVKRNQIPIVLQPKEIRLLTYLMRNAEQVVTRESLQEFVWPNSSDMNPNAIDVQISRLRKKIDKEFGFPLIHTIRNVGYLLGRRELA